MAVAVRAFVLLILALSVRSDPTPTPTPWPHQFHSILFMNASGAISFVDLWYDWPGGRNFNIIQDQLSGPPLYDLEWNNGTSFIYTLQAPQHCRTVHPGVGILPPNWLHGATYLGQRSVDGFLCNVWTKAEFIVYYEDVATKRPVHWVFYTGRAAHVITFEVGAVLEDVKWQAPHYCFQENRCTRNCSSAVFSVPTSPAWPPPCEGWLGRRISPLDAPWFHDGVVASPFLSLRPAASLRGLAGPEDLALLPLLVPGCYRRPHPSLRQRRLRFTAGIDRRLAFSEFLIRKDP